MEAGSLKQDMIVGYRGFANHRGMTVNRQPNAEKRTALQNGPPCKTDRPVLGLAMLNRKIIGTTPADRISVLSPDDS